MVQSGIAYLTICCGLSIGLCMQFLCERILQSTGHPAGFMIVQGSGALLNIVLDPIFIFVFKMGVVGAAVATVIGQFCGCGLALYMNLRKNHDLHLGSGASGRTGRSWAISMPSACPPW